MDDTNHKTIYWTSLSVSFVVLQVLFMLLLHFLRQSWAPGVLLPPLLTLSSLIATTVCRRLGLSSDGRTIEMFTVLNSEIDPWIAEVRADPRIWKGLAALSSCFSGFVLLVIRLARSVPGTEIFGYMLAVGAAIIAILFWWAGVKRWGFMARADLDGIVIASGIGRKRIAWASIASCTVTTIYNTFGQRSQTIVVLQGRGKQNSATICLTGVPRSQAEQFVQHLKSQFQDTKCLDARLNKR